MKCLKEDMELDRMKEEEEAIRMKVEKKKLMSFMEQQEKYMPPPSTSSSAPPSSLTMKDIIELQSPDGSWCLDKVLLHLVSLASPKISSTPPSPFAPSLKKDHRALAWATVIALWLLETHCAHQKQEWKRIAAKGNRFLKESGLSYKDSLNFI